MANLDDTPDLTDLARVAAGVRAACDDQMSARPGLRAAMRMAASAADLGQLLTATEDYLEENARLKFESAGAPDFSSMNSRAAQALLRAADLTAGLLARAARNTVEPAAAVALADIGAKAADGCGWTCSSTRLNGTPFHFPIALQPSTQSWQVIWVRLGKAFKSSSE